MQGVICSGLTILTGLTKVEKAKAAIKSVSFNPITR